MGWYSPDRIAVYNLTYSPESIDFSTVTHLVFAGISVYPNGSSACSPAMDAGSIAERVFLYAKGWANGTKVAAGNGTKIQMVVSDIDMIEGWMYNEEYRGRLMASVGENLRKCGYDGIEFDYEGPATPEVGDKFTGPNTREPGTC